MITPPPGTPGVYLIHFDRPLSHARHYIGWAADIGRRFQEHQDGRSRAHIITAAYHAGIRLHLVRTWPCKPRDWERYLKSQKAAGRLYCPICRGKP